MALWQLVDDLIPYIPDRGQSMFASGGVETVTRGGNSPYAGTSGKLWVSYFTAIASTTLTRLGMFAGSVAGSGITLARLALFTVAADDSITKVAQTDSDNTVGSSTYTLHERVLSTVGGFPASYALVPRTRYALGWLQVATTPCELFGHYPIAPGDAPVACRSIAAQTDIAASYAVASIPADAFSIYQRGRP
jgi:hypothetical protein